jgi:hypothetical protein
VKSLYLNVKRITSRSLHFPRVFNVLAERLTAQPRTASARSRIFHFPAKMAGLKQISHFDQETKDARARSGGPGLGSQAFSRNN